MMPIEHAAAEAILHAGQATVEDVRRVWQHIASHTHADPYDSTQQAATLTPHNATPGASMSLTTIADTLEHDVATAVGDVTAKVSASVAEVRKMAAAVEQDPVAQAALNLAEDLSPAVRAAAAVLLPEFAAVHETAIDGVLAIFRAVLATAPKTAPAA